MEFKTGSEGSYVVAIQRALNEKIGTSLITDGDYGPATEKAVMTYQLQCGYETTGIVNDDLFAELCVEQLPAEQNMITAEELSTILEIKPDKALLYISALNKAMFEFQINTPERIAMFLANIGAETGGLSTFVENLNYSATGLAKTWPKRFADSSGKPNGLATNIAGNQKTIANVVYADRMGNGGPSTGDGWNYRGRSPIMATGKDMYAELADVLGVDCLNGPHLLENPVVGFRAAGYVWMAHGSNEAADADDFDGACDRINLGHKTRTYGDAIGFGERAKYYENAKKVWGL